MPGGPPGSGPTSRGAAPERGDDEAGVIHDEDGWLRRHAATLFDIDADGRLTILNEPEPDPAPRLFVARARGTALLRLRADVPAGVAGRCERAVEDLPRWDGDESDGTAYSALREALAGMGPVTAESCGPAFRFPADPAGCTDDGTLVIDGTTAHLLEPHFPYTRSVLAARAPVVGVVRDGAVVSACFCARRRPAACEAGVATIEAFRGRGLATVAVRAWRRAAEAAGMTPLYSTSWDNLASRRVAARLGLVAYCETLSLT
jgi:hypothetical protein